MSLYRGWFTLLSGMACSPSQWKVLRMHGSCWVRPVVGRWWHHCVGVPLLGSASLPAWPHSLVEGLVLGQPSMVPELPEP